MARFAVSYNAEAFRHKANPDADWNPQIKWSRDLKQDAKRGKLVEFDPSSVRLVSYRPFTKRSLYFDRILNEEIYNWPKYSEGPLICVTDVASGKPFMCLMTAGLTDLHLAGPGASTRCFPLSHLRDNELGRFRRHYAEETITKESIFHYLYGLLHQPEYRDRYAANLKRDLPRIPFGPDFHAFANAGRELARLHVEYESLDPWPLGRIEDSTVPYTERVTRLKVSPDRESIHVNQALTLRNIPSEAFENRVGSRSAIEWIVDQYQVKSDSDPNREDDPGYIVRLISQVVRLSIETVHVIRSLPSLK